MHRSQGLCPSISCQGQRAPGEHNGAEASTFLSPHRVTKTDAVGSVNKTPSKEVKADPTVTIVCSGMRQREALKNQTESDLTICVEWQSDFPQDLLRWPTLLRCCHHKTSRKNPPPTEV